MGEPEPPSAPAPARREQLLGMLAELIARGGPGRFVASPIAPGRHAFPDPWRATRGGVHALLRRLAVHADLAVTITLTDDRLGAPPTERKPETRVGLVQVRRARSPSAGAITDAALAHDASARPPGPGDQLGFRIEFLGEDDVAGTLAHELGVAYAALHRPDVLDPYRLGEQVELEVDAERDHERGSVAAVYLGLGVLAANAAFQEYSRAGRFNGGYSPLEYDVLRAGYLSMSELAFLLAVQAVACGRPVPAGLSAPQRDEVIAWMAALERDAPALRDRLGLPAELPSEVRPAAVAFTDIDLADDAPAPQLVAFRWRTNRGGVGFVAGAVLGMGVAMLLAGNQLAPLLVLGAAGGGHLVGRRVRVPRCSACANVVAPSASTCPRCGAALRGDIARLADRLEAEEGLDDSRDHRLDS